MFRISFLFIFVLSYTMLWEFSNTWSPVHGERLYASEGIFPILLNEPSSSELSEFGKFGRVKLRRTPKFLPSSAEYGQVRPSSAKFGPSWAAFGWDSPSSGWVRLIRLSWREFGWFLFDEDCRIPRVQISRNAEKSLEHNGTIMVDYGSKDSMPATFEDTFGQNLNIRTRESGWQTWNRRRMGKL